MPLEDLSVSEITCEIRIFRIIKHHNRSRRIAAIYRTTVESPRNVTLAPLSYHTDYDRTLIFSLSTVGIIT